MDPGYRRLVSGRGGGKGDGGGAEAPDEAPDTLQSRQVARIREALSEGPIEGFVHPTFPLLDIYFDGTPVQGPFDWGAQADGHTATGSKVFSNNPGGPNFQVFRNQNGVVKPKKSPWKGRWITGTNIPYGTFIESVEDEHHLTLSQAATGNTSAGAWQLGGPLNFKGVNFQFRSGTQGQGYMAGFPAAEVTTAVNVRVLKNLPYNHSFTDAQLDALRVDIRFPRLVRTDTDDGDTHGTSVRLKLKINGSVIIDDTVTGKSSGGYTRTYKIELANLGAQPWALQVQRMTDDSTSNALQNDTWVDAYTEVIYGKLRHPNTAMVGLKVNAKNFSSIPTRAYHIKGLLCKVPSNYNPVTRIYTGVWDGTFQTAYTNSAPWCWYDMVTQNRYGLGHFLIEANVDKFALYTIAQYCDATNARPGNPNNDYGPNGKHGVPNGRGGFEPRMTCNLYIQRKEDAIKVLQDMAGIFRGMLTYVNGTVTPVQDAPGDPSAYRMFSPANVVNGQFNYSGAGMRSRHNVAIVTWSDLSDVGTIKQEYVEDHDGITKQGGINQLEITGFGCTSRSQARRMGLWAIYAEKTMTDTVAFSTALEGYFITPGKLFTVQDPFRAGAEFSGRLKPGTTGTHLFLDRSVVLQAGKTYTVAVINPATGAYTSRSVTQAAGTWSDITIAALGFTPEADQLWQIAANDLEPEIFRTMSVIAKDKQTIEIVGLKYNESLYGFVDFDHPLEDPPISQLPPAGGVLPPVGPLISETIQVIRPDGTIRQDLELGWGESPDPYFFRYIVEWRRNSGNWYRNNDVETNSFTLLNAPQGDYELKVIAVNTINARSDPLEGEHEVLPPPSNITGIAGLTVWGGNHFENGRAIFETRDCHFFWRGTSGTGPGSPFAPDMGLEAGAPGTPDSIAVGFHVEIYNDDDRIWQDNTSASEYVFSWERNKNAVETYYGPGFGPLRIFRIEVSVRFSDGTLSLPARLTVENKLPPPPRNVTTLVGNGFIDWQWDLPTAPDLDHFALFASLDPEDEEPEQVAEFHGTSGTYHPPDTQTRYYWLGSVDSFGNVSANVPQGPPPGGFVLPPRFAPPAGTYQGPVDVAITCDTPGTSIRYALTEIGQNPTVFTVYGGPVHITGRKTLHAVATTTQPPFEQSVAQGNYYCDGYQPPPPPPGQTPANDNFANRIGLPGQAGTRAGTTVGATTEIGEPSTAPESSNKTVWYTWATGNAGKLIYFWAHSSNFVIEAFTGSAVNALTLVAKSTGGVLFFPQVAATTYQIRVRPVSDGASAAFNLLWYTPTVSAPVFDPPPGFFELEWPARRLIFTASSETVGAHLYWAFGRDPTTTDYDGYVLRNRATFDMTPGIWDLRVIAVRDQWLDSSVSQGTFHIEQSLGPPCPRPTYAPAPGSFQTFPMDVVIGVEPAPDTFEPDAPASMTGLELWLRADSIDQVDGSQVAEWRDESGNDRHATQASPSAKPTLHLDAVNGKPAVKFNPLLSNMFMTTPSVGITQPNTVIVVGKQTSTATEGRFIDSAVGGTRQLLGLTITAGRFDSYAGTASVQGSKNRSGAFHILTMVFNGASSVGYLDGAQEVAGNPGSNGLGVVYLGNDGGGSAYLTGEIAEVLIFDHALSSEERAGVESYLATKYGLASVGGGDSDGPGVPLDPLTVFFIKYTTDGRLPSRNGPGTTIPQGGTAHLATPCYLKAISFTRGREDSPLQIGRYKLAGRLPAPTFTPGGGLYGAFPMNVTVRCSQQSGVQMRYTTDGSTPTETNGVLIAGSSGTAVVPLPGTTLKAVAFGTGFPTSPVTSALYNGLIAPPDVTPPDVFYDPGATQNVELDLELGYDPGAPSAIGGLQLWLKADSIVSLNDGDPVDTWEDSSPNGNDATATLRPTFKENVIGSKPGLLFDGVDDFMEVAANGGMQSANYTIFAVIKTGASVAGSVLAEDYALSGAPDNNVRYEFGYWFDAVGSGDRFGVGHFNTTWLTAYKAANDTANTAHIYAGRYDGAALKLYESGTEVASTTGTLATAGARRWWVGRRHDEAVGTEPYFKGHILELIVYDSALSTTDRQAVEAYLAAKYSGAFGPAVNARYTTDGTEPTRSHGTLVTSFPTTVPISGGFRELRAIAFAVDPTSGYNDSDVKLSTYDWKQTPLS